METELEEECNSLGCVCIDYIDPFIVYPHSQSSVFHVV